MVASCKAGEAGEARELSDRCKNMTFTSCLYIKLYKKKKKGNLEHATSMRNLDIICHNWALLNYILCGAAPVFLTHISCNIGHRPQESTPESSRTRCFITTRLRDISDLCVQLLGEIRASVLQQYISSYICVIPAVPQASGFPLIKSSDSTLDTACDVTSTGLASCTSCIKHFFNIKMCWQAHCSQHDFRYFSVYLCSLINHFLAVLIKAFLHLSKGLIYCFLLFL